MKVSTKDLEDSASFSNRRWKNRRWMTWITLLFTLFITAALFFLSPDKIEALVPIFSYFYVFAGSVVGCYIGFATIGDRDDLTKLITKDDNNG